ncbi:flagellar filament capping protein FliD [Peribacillus sp. SCS-155]|uniref:flagellar filament capping protein FliD n=1 Tax=Peribacillus sedimenti TaxID=3115297 RepID=UPI0039062202
MRITGFSGFDTESMIKELMTAQRKPREKLTQQKQLADWKMDAYREVNTKISELRNMMQDMRWPSAFKKSSTESTNSGVVAATVIGSPSLTTYEIKDVKLATQDTTNTVKFFTSGITDPAVTKLTDAAVGLTDGDTITINDKSYRVTADSTINDLINAFGTSSKVKVSYSVTEKSITIDSLGKGAAAQAINISFSNTDVANRFAGKLHIKAGTVSNTSNTYATTTPDTNISSVQSTIKAQAQATINGIIYKSDTNSISYDGVRFDLKMTTTTGTTPITVTQKQDSTAVFESVKKFINTYNGIVDDLNKLVGERKARDYKPLSDEQKEAMSEDEIKRWEAKAKEGLLGRDSVISNLLFKMRYATNNPVVTIDDYGSTSASVADIGLGLADSWQDNGKIKLDETKLKSMIETDITKVIDVFSKSTNNITESTEAAKKTTQNTEKFEQSGIADRLFDQLEATMKQLGQQALNGPSSTIGKQINQLDNKITEFDKRMIAIENRYYRQFSAMEKALSQANSQSSWLAGQLGGMS